MKVYIAARFSRRAEAYALAVGLIAHGHEISCRGVMRHKTHTMPSGLSEQAEDAERQRYAMENVEDMRLADWCVSLTEQPRNDSRGGRHVEFGYMLALGATMSVIGPRETVFHHLPHVRHYGSLAAFMAELK